MNSNREARIHKLADDLIDLQNALATALDGEESKANFNPHQPRIPRGQTWGGRWASAGGAGGGAMQRMPSAPSPQPIRSTNTQPAAPSQIWANIETGMRSANREVQQFLVRNRDPITRTLGGLQAFGGGLEMVGGVTVVTGGIVTSETGVGVAIAAAGAWMVSNGYDNFTTGWRALLTGAPRETNLHLNLRRLGLSDDEATAVEVLLGGGVTAGATRLSREALEQAALRGLQERAIRDLSRTPLNVRTAAGRRIWEEPNIQTRGEAWEEYDAARTGMDRTPREFPVFDQLDRNTGIAISNKTLDLVTLRYSTSDRNAVYNRLVSYIDSAAHFPRSSRERLALGNSQILDRRLHVVFPAGEALPGQTLQIAAAEQYAIRNHVHLQIEYAR